jgi:hypothetical protein
MNLVEAEQVVRSGRIEMSDVRAFGRALRVFIEEYDRRYAELVELRKERAAWEMGVLAMLFGGLDKGTADRVQARIRELMNQ